MFTCIAYFHTRTHNCSHAYVLVHTNIQIHTSTLSYMHVFVYRHIRECMHVYSCMHVYRKHVFFLPTAVFDSELHASKQVCRCTRLCEFLAPVQMPSPTCRCCSGRHTQSAHASTRADTVTLTRCTCPSETRTRDSGQEASRESQH
jgi:hypothetical protein